MSMNGQRRRRLLFGGLCVAAVLAHGYGPAAAQTASARDGGSISLNGDWQFALAPNAAEAEKMGHFYETAFKTDAFRPLKVPANWAMHGFEEPLYAQHFKIGDTDNLPEATEAEGFYLHRFQVPREIEGKRAVLHFDGVWDSAEVWLNGQLLGRHDSGFTGFQFDVAQHLKPGVENLLAVRVRQKTLNSMLDINDDWVLGGIYRDVYLETMPSEAYIERLEAVTKFDNQFRDANLNLRVFFGRLLNTPQPIQARVILTDAGGAEVARGDYDGAIKTCGFVVCGQDVSFTMPVRAPKQWSAEMPNLYDLRVELMLGGRVIHTRREKVGFREVSTAGGVLTVNGHPVRLRGVGRHDEYPDVGRATRPEHWLKDIQMMKAANINAVRTTHYPPAEGFIKLCDEIGLYVIDEVPLGFGGDLLLDDALTAPVLLRARETVRRDRDHPSVIIWSVGNEDPLTDLHLAAIRYVKAADPTRPVLMPWNADESLPPEIDILAPHYKSAEEFDRMAAAARRPVLTTEYTHALGPDDFGGLEDRWEAITTHSAGAGGMIWHWEDQGIVRKINGRTVLDPLTDLGKYKARGTELVRHRAGGTTPVGADTIMDSHGVFGTDGIVDPDRTPQRDYWETKAVYAPVRVMADELPLRPGQQTASIPLRNDYDFSDLSTVRVKWRLMRDGTELKAGEARLSAPPRTTKSLDVPVDAIGRLVPADYYVDLSIQHEDGSEIVARSVRLRSGAADTAAQGPAVSPRALPQVKRDGARLTVTAGDASYSFDAQAAQLDRVTLKGETVVTGSRPTIWRPLTISEVRLFRGGDEKETPLVPELDHFQTTVRKWTVTEAAEGVRIEAEAEYRVDEANGFTGRFDYLINPAGALQVNYFIKPQIQLGWVPEIGLRFDTAPGLTALRWAGLGPLDSTPDKHSATRFGVWSAQSGDATIEGVKSRVEWAELMNPTGSGLRIAGAPFVRFDGVPAGPGSFRVLSAVVGSSTKFKRPERPEDRLDVTPGKEFVGGFTLSATLPAQ